MSITETTRQYGDSRKLQARAHLHQTYTVADEGWFEWLAGRIPLSAGDSVLDIGCGPGWFWAKAAERLPDGLQLTLADSSPGMVGEAMERCSGLPFAAVAGHTADAASLPFADASFDVVTAMHMLYHLPDPAQAIAECHRVLKPGGLLAVTTNGLDNLREYYALGTVFGADPVDPAALSFGFDKAETLLRQRFGTVTLAEHPAHLRITDAEDIVSALTSYPPGEDATPDQMAALRAAIATAFAGTGALHVRKQVGLFVSRKSARG